MIYHDANFDEEPLNRFMRERHCRTIADKGGQTFDLIETNEALWEVLRGVANHLASNDSFLGIEVSAAQIPADRVGAENWLRGRGNLGEWHTIP